MKPGDVIVGYAHTRGGVVCEGRAMLDSGECIRVRAFEPMPVGFLGGFVRSAARVVKNVAKSKALRGVAKTALDVAATVGVPGAGAVRTGIDIAEKALAGAKRADASAEAEAATAARTVPAAKPAAVPRRMMWGPAADPAQAARLALRIRPPTARARGPMADAETLRASLRLVRLLPREERTSVVRRLLGL